MKGTLSNSVNRVAIADALLRLGIPGYLYGIHGSYFQNGVLRVWRVGRRCFHITSEVPEGYILGPLLWYVMYNKVLKVKFPVGMAIVGFVDDDITLEVYDEPIEEGELTAAHSIAIGENWMSSAMHQHITSR